MNITNPTSFSAPNLTLATSNSSGTAGALRADDSIALFDATVPTTAAFGASAAVGSVAITARRDHVHGMMADPTSFATPSLTFTTSNSSGTAGALHADDSIAIFDATVPTTAAFGASAAAGSVAITARRDHVHGMMATPALGLVLIGTEVADDAEDLTIDGLDSDYATYLLVAADIKPVTDQQDCGFQFGDSGGIDEGSSDYSFHQQKLSPASALYVGQVSAAAGKINMAGNGVGNAASEGFSCCVWLHRSDDGSRLTRCSGTMTYGDGSNVVTGGTVIGQRNSTMVLTQVRFKMDSGNITTGRFSIWGVNHT